MKRKIHLLKRSSFPVHSFFDHLLRGTEYYHNREFEWAAEEWGAAGWLDYQKPINLKRQNGRIFCGGFIREVPFLFFLYAVFASKVNGVGTIKTNGISKSLIFNEGRLVRAATTLPHERIGNFIVQREQLSFRTLNELVDNAKKQGKKIGQLLVEKGLLSRGALQEMLLLQIEHITVDILQWQRGHFYFLEKPIARDFIVNFAPLNLARIAIGKEFRFNEFRNKIPNMKAIFRLSPFAEINREKILQKLKGKQKYIFSLICGTRNIEQIAKFSGIDDAATVEILYRLNAAGMIRQSREIIEYEDKQYNEIANVLDTLLGIYTYVAHMLFSELGARAEDVIRQARLALNKAHQEMFLGIPLETSPEVTKELILSNIAQHYPEPKQRELFIEAFCDLFENLRLRTGKYIGRRFVDDTTGKIRSELKNIDRYAEKTSLRNHLLEIFNPMVQ
jgi:hypothetical protein